MANFLTKAPTYYVVAVTFPFDKVLRQIFVPRMALAHTLIQDPFYVIFELTV